MNTCIESYSYLCYLHTYICNLQNVLELPWNFHNKHNYFEHTHSVLCRNLIQFCEKCVKNRYVFRTYIWVHITLQLNSNGESRGVQKKLRQQLTLWGLITIWSFDYVLQQKLGLLSLCAKRLKIVVKYKH